MGTRGGQREIHRGRRCRQNGQVAILFALVFTFMFILFGFVINFSQLINDKINLQIAADAAAYSGAAIQANILNRIAMVNYRLRQDWKEFAMRMLVTHGRHNRGFPRGQGVFSGEAQMASHPPFACQQSQGYVSLSGVVYAQDTNLCRNADPTTGGLPPIVVPPLIVPWDPFATAIVTSIKRIQQAANFECQASARDNEQLANHMVSVFGARSQFHSNQLRELENFMNSINGENPSDGSTNPILRTAYESASRNLTATNAENFQMEVLHPAGGKYLELIPTNVTADMYFMNFQEQGNGCVGQPGSFPFDNVTVNFTKRRELLTYFAVKLTARPRLFFMPERWISDAFPTLVAYSAAKPFGSRIGPRPTTDSFLPVPNRPGNASRLINFSMRPNDPVGFFNTKVLAYLDALHPFNGIGRPDGNQTTGWPEPNKPDNVRLALQAIRAPTMFDAMFYTTIPDAGPNQSIDYLEPQFAAALYPDYIESADQNNNLIQLQQPPTAPYFPFGVGSKNFGPGWIQIDANPGAIGAYGAYSSEQPGTHSVTSIEGFPGMANPNEFGWATREQIHSGWTPAGKSPRMGYSVKFISLEALVGGFRIQDSETGAETPIENPPQGDSDLSRVLH